MIKPTRRTRLADAAIGATPPPAGRADPGDDSVWALSDSDPRWLLKLLDEGLEREQSLWERPRRAFRGSGSGEQCARALTLDCMGHRVPFEARTLRIFKTGNSIEDVIVAGMERANMLESTQGEVRYDDPPTVGHVDCVLRRPGTGERVLGEIKSIKQELFKALPREHGPVLAGESPLNKGWYLGYLKQWNAYAWSPTIDIEIGFLLFEAKNEQQQKIYWLLRDPELLEAVMETRREAAPYITQDPMRAAPVPAGFDPDDQGRGSACGRCGRRYLCKRLPAGPIGYDEVREADAKVRG